MADHLLDQKAVTARFQAGTTALGHHWTLHDDGDAEIGSTQRTHSGGLVGRALWKTVTVTGMDGGNDIRADVQDADGNVLLKVVGQGGKPRRVDLAGPDGEPWGVAKRTPGEGFTIEDEAGNELLLVPILEGQAPPWEVRTPDGAVIAVLQREKAKLATVGDLLADELLGLGTASSQVDFQRTMHLGFDGSRTYGITLDEHPADARLRTLVVLLPAIAAYSY